jgi:hypothetical protein
MDNIILTPKQAIGVLDTHLEKRKKRVHTFTGMGFGLFGCDMDLTQIKAMIKNAKVDEIAISGVNMQTVSHGIAVFDNDRGWLFISTDNNKLKNLLKDLLD